MRLSLAMIVKDEKETLARVLEQAAEFCDELVVVDTGSTDGSRAIAEAAGAKVVDFEWIDDFSAARNAAFSHCSGDWITWLDADDSVPIEVRRGIKAAKADVLSDDIDAVWMPYRYHFAPDTDQCTFSFNRERMIRRAANLTWAGRVHEVLTIPAGRSVERADLYIEHRPAPEKYERRVGRNLRILEAAVAEGDDSPRTLFYFANELRDSGRLEEALATYERYMASPAAEWETYSALVSMLQCASRLHRIDAAISFGLQAIAIDASRAEAHLGVGDVFFAAENWSRAAPFYAAATMAVRPSTGFIADIDYSWRPWDQLGVCLINSGRLAQGIEATMRSLREGNPDRARLTANMNWAVDRLGGGPNDSS